MATGTSILISSPTSPSSSSAEEAPSSLSSALSGRRSSRSSGDERFGCDLFVECEAPRPCLELLEFREDGPFFDLTMVTIEKAWEMLLARFGDDNLPRKSLDNHVPDTGEVV